MSQSYETEFKKKMVRLHMGQGKLIAASQPNMAYPRQAFSNGVDNLVKNTDYKSNLKVSNEME